MIFVAVGSIDKAWNMAESIFIIEREMVEKGQRIYQDVEAQVQNLLVDKIVVIHPSTLGFHNYTPVSPFGIASNLGI